jgi:hypothetical protein
MKSRAYMVLCRMTRNALYDLIDETQKVAVVLYRLRMDVYCGSDPTICISNEGRATLCLQIYFNSSHGHWKSPGICGCRRKYELSEVVTHEAGSSRTVSYVVYHS